MHPQVSNLARIIGSKLAKLPSSESLIGHVGRTLLLGPCQLNISTPRLAICSHICFFSASIFAAATCSWPLKFARAHVLALPILLYVLPPHRILISRPEEEDLQRSSRHMNTYLNLFPSNVCGDFTSKSVTNGQPWRSDN